MSRKVKNDGTGHFPFDVFLVGVVIEQQRGPVEMGRGFAGFRQRAIQRRQTGARGTGDGRRKDDKTSRSVV